MTASTNAPLYIGIAFFSPEIIAIVLGPDWERSAELLRLLALWGGIRSTGNPVGSLLYGMGRADMALKWNLSMAPILPLVLWIGSRGGAQGIAWALLIFQLVLFIPYWYFLVRKLCYASLLDYSISALKPFILAAFAVGPAFLLASQFESAVLRLLVGLSVAAPLYLMISFLANRDWVLAMSELTGSWIPSLRD